MIKGNNIEFFRGCSDHRDQLSCIFYLKKLPCLLQCSTIKGPLGFEGNWCRKNEHTISSVSPAIWARFRSTKHDTSTRIWTRSITSPKCSMFWRVRQNRVLKYNQSMLRRRQNLPALKIWMFECGHRRQHKNLSRQNLSFDFVDTILVL